MTKRKFGIVLVGHPASGKSTLGTILSTKLSGVFLEQDTFISALKPTANSLVSPEIETQSIRNLTDKICKLDDKGHIVVAATCLARDGDMRILFEGLPRQFRIIILYCPHEEALRRNAERPVSERVPSKYIVEACDFFSSNKFDARSVQSYNTLELSASHIVNRIMDEGHDE